MSDAAADSADRHGFFSRLRLPFLGRRGKGGARGSGARRKRRFRVGKTRWITLVLLALFMALRVWDPGPLEILRLKTFDFYQQFKPRELLPNSPVVIIDLDEDSLKEIGQWPWPRTIVAQLVENLFQLGVGVVGFDIVFPEKDRMSGKSVAESLSGLDDEIKKMLRALPGNDQVFAKVIRASRRVVLGQAGFNEPGEDDGRKPLRSRVFERATKGAPKPQVWVPSMPRLIRNNEIIEQAAAGHGLLSLLPEPDGIVRRVPAFIRHKNRLYPTLSVEMLRVWAGRPGVVAFGNQAGIYKVAISRQLSIPTDRNGRIWPYFSKSDKKKYVSARDILSGAVDPARIQGKLALIGTSAVGLLDIKTVPTEPFIPGVEIHAQLIESALTGAYLVRPNFADAAEMAIALFGGLLIIILVPWIGARWTLLFFIAVAFGAAGTSWFLFSEKRMILDAAFAIITILTLYVVLTYSGYAAEQKQQRQTRGAFAKYLSPAMVEQVVENPALLTLGGEKRDLTLLFCDVRGFTTISEQFDAEGLTVLINKLLTPLTNIILDRQGTVDKYMGDCIMAFWNAPLDVENHARDGCLSAIDMVAAMAPLNQRLEAEAKEEGRKHIPLKVGLGLNTGEAVVGNMGTAQRMDYSVLGDTVNTAARLEGQSKTYGVDIVLGPGTWERVPELATIELDFIQVKGKTVGLHVYALMGGESLADDADFQAMKVAVDGMLAAYRGQDWARARELVARVRELGQDFKLDIFCDLYEGRIKAYEIEPPSPDWDGIFIATTK